MDFIIASSLRNHRLKDLVITYDVSCQWSKKVGPRFDIYPNDLDFRRDGTRIRYMVPKFHLPAHVQACQTDFSLNYNYHVGRTDGEGIERGWDNINPIATSTREMGPGARKDRLDHILNDMNWVKVCRMGVLIYLDDAELA